MSQVLVRMKCRAASRLLVVSATFTVATPALVGTRYVTTRIL